VERNLGDGDVPYCQPWHGRQARKNTAGDAAEERTERGAPRLYRRMAIRLRVSPREKPLRAGCRLHVEGFDVGGADPQAVLGQCREVQHNGIVVNVGDEAGGHGELSVKS